MGSRAANAEDESPSTVSINENLSWDTDWQIDRKRAKTEDEKEQRRIERVLRNRQAAQSSRERKRQEVEKLEGEKHEIELQNQRLKERLMAVEHEKFLLAQQVNKLTADMYAMTGRSGTAPVSMASGAPSPPLDTDFQTPEPIKQELDDFLLALPTPQTSVNPSLFSSRPSSSCSLSPSPSSIGLGLSDLGATSDLTQHPAAMLCDLQCQSEAARSALSPAVIRPPPSKGVFIQLLYLTLLSVTYSRLLLPLRLIFLSIQTGSPLPSKISPRATPMIFLLINLLISTPPNLTPPTTTSSSTTTTRPTNPNVSTTPSTPLPAARRPTFRLRLLRRLLFCSPALARPLRDATSKAMRTKISRTLTGTLTDSLRGEKREVDDDAGDGNGRRKIEGHERPGQRDTTRDEGAMMIWAVKMIEKEMRSRRLMTRKKCITMRSKRSWSSDGGWMLFCVAVGIGLLWLVLGWLKNDGDFCSQINRYPNSGSCRAWKGAQHVRVCHISTIDDLPSIDNDSVMKNMKEYPLAISHSLIKWNSKVLIYPPTYSPPFQNLNTYLQFRIHAISSPTYPSKHLIQNLPAPLPPSLPSLSRVRWSSVEIDVEIIVVGLNDEVWCCWYHIHLYGTERKRPRANRWKSWNRCYAINWDD